MEKDLYKEAAKYRGEIINETIWLEKRMDDYIAYYFCDDTDRNREMHLLFLGDNRMSFEGKKQIFDFIARTHDIEWYQSYKSRRSTSVKKGSIAMNNDMCYIMEKRNLLAHCVLDSSESARAKDIGVVSFVRYKNEEKKFEFTESIFREIREVLYDLSFYFINKELSESSKFRQLYLTNEISSPPSSLPDENI